MFAVEMDQQAPTEQFGGFMGPSPGKPQVESKFIGNPQARTHLHTPCGHTVKCFGHFGIESWCKLRTMLAFVARTAPAFLALI